MMDEKAAQKILDDNRALHDAPGYAEFYETYLGHLCNPWEQGIFEADLGRMAAQLPDGFSALDLGAGTGNLSLKLLGLGAKVTAVDLSQPMLDRLAEHAKDAGPRLDVVCRDIDTYLCQCAEAFDLVAACSFYHHLPDYLASLERAADHVAPGGFLYLAHEPAHRRTVSLTADVLERFDFLLQRVESRLGLPFAPPRDDPYYDADSLADYWDTREGLDHEEMARRLSDRDFHVEMTLYDSKRHRILHTLVKLARTKRLVRMVAKRSVETHYTPGGFSNDQAYRVAEAQAGNNARAGRDARQKTRRTQGQNPRHP